jgi:hypothetical protein
MNASTANPPDLLTQLREEAERAQGVADDLRVHAYFRKRHARLAELRRLEIRELTQPSGYVENACVANPFAHTPRHTAHWQENIAL